MIHCGAYDAPVNTTALLLDWPQQKNTKYEVVDERKVTRCNGRVERYLIRPPDEPNPKSWQIDISILVSAG